MERSCDDSPGAWSLNRSSTVEETALAYLSLLKKRYCRHRTMILGLKVERCHGLAPVQYAVALEMNMHRMVCIAHEGY